jgi:hypothetical protein
MRRDENKKDNSNMKRAPKPAPAPPAKVWIVNIVGGEQAGGMIAYGTKHDAELFANPFNAARRGTAIILELEVQ